MIIHTHDTHKLLTLYVPSVLWSRSLMSWKFLCSSKGRFSIPREKKKNWESLHFIGLIAAFKVQIQKGIQFPLLGTAGFIRNSTHHSFISGGCVCTSPQLTLPSRPSFPTICPFSDLTLSISPSFSLIPSTLLALNPNTHLVSSTHHTHTDSSTLLSVS